MGEEMYGTLAVAAAMQLLHPLAQISQGGWVFNKGRNNCDILGGGHYTATADMTENHEIYTPHPIGISQRHLILEKLEWLG